MKTKSNEHTPTPWRAVDIRATERGKRGIVYYQIKQGNGAKSTIGFAGVYEGKNPAADAEFIVKACNAYEAQAAEIERLRGLLSRTFEWATLNQSDTYCEYCATHAFKYADNNGEWTGKVDPISHKDDCIVKLVQAELDKAQS